MSQNIFRKNYLELIGIIKLQGINLRFGYEKKSAVQKMKLRWYLSLSTFYIIIINLLLYSLITLL